MRRNKLTLFEGILFMIKKIIWKLRWHLMSEPQRMTYWRSIGVRIGTGCKIEKDVSFGTEPYLIRIGNDVRLTSNVQFITHDGGMWVIRNKYGIKDADKFGCIEIGNNVNIGWNTMIMPNVKIGNNCVIGAGAVVTKNIPDNSVAVGVPARVIETIDEYWEKNKDKIDHTKAFSAEKKKQYLLEKYGDYLNGSK